MFSHVTPPASEPVTLIEAKSHLRVDFDADDTLITTLISTARQFVENCTGRALVSRVVRVDADNWDSEILLPLNPVVSISSIKYMDSDGVEQTLASTEYQLATQKLPARVKPAYGASWPAIRSGLYDSVKVEFTAGYGDAGAVPNDLKHAVLFMIAHLYEQREPVVVAGNIDVKTVPFAVDALMDIYRVYL